MNESFSTIEEAVAREHFVITPHGVSMWPMIRNGKDTVLIEPVNGRLKKYDIPLYKDKRGRYVMILWTVPISSVISSAAKYSACTGIST